MRFFRIPAFTGIETHRDDMDRGSLRTVEGCVPHGPGGLRSGPVWSKIGDVDQFSTGSENHASAADDGQGNSLMFVSRESEVHDLLVMSTENTALVSLGAGYGVINSSIYNQADATLTPIGNRLYALGDGTAEAVTVGKGPPEGGHLVYPDQTLYSQEWSRFPNCQFYVSGPKKTIFAAGNPDDPLTVYISEPAGLTQPVRDSPYSTSETNYHEGVLSEVRILGSNASKITALSTRGDKVVVHTDKGCHILYAPTSDQASTGYRTEQVAATNTSAAVNSQTVAGDGGTQPFWLGHDGQIYKDEAAVRGAEDFKSYADPQQASWKAKGKWEKEHPANLANSFATYDSQSGMYWVFVKSSIISQNTQPSAHGPTNLTAVQDSGVVNPPASGPTDFDAEQQAVVVPPANGPTNFNAVQPPSSGLAWNAPLQDGWTHTIQLQEDYAGLPTIENLTAVSNMSDTSGLRSSTPFTISGTDAALFSLSTTNAFPSLLTSVSPLDYETKSSYSIIVTAHATDGSTIWYNINLVVLDVAEVPVTGPSNFTAVQSVINPPAQGPVNLAFSIPGPPYYGPRFLVTEPNTVPPVNGPTNFGTAQYAIPNPFIGMDSREMAAGQGTLYVLGEFGKLFGRGAGFEGQLGQGNNASTGTFDPVTNYGTPESANFVEIDEHVGHVSASSWNCVWLKNSTGNLGEMYGTGSASFGGMPGSGTNTPVRIMTDQTMTSCAAGYGSGMHVTDNGKLYVYGLGHRMWWTTPNYLTDDGYPGFDTQWSEPVKMCRMSNESTKICTRWFIDNDGYLFSYGYNYDGQLGRDPTEQTNWPHYPHDWVPRKTPIYDVVDVIADAACTYFIKSDGSLWMVGQMNSAHNPGTPGHIPTLIDTDVTYAASRSGIACYGTCASYGGLVYRKSDATIWGLGKLPGLGHANEATAPEQIDTDVLPGYLTLGGWGLAYAKFKQGTTLSIYQAGDPNDPWKWGLFGEQSYSGSGDSVPHITTPVETGTVTG